MHSRGSVACDEPFAADGFSLDREQLQHPCLFTPVRDVFHDLPDAPSVTGGSRSSRGH
jgi:hypothetical protein